MAPVCCVALCARATVSLLQIRVLHWLCQSNKLKQNRTVVSCRLSMRVGAVTLNCDCLARCGPVTLCCRSTQ